MHQFSLLAKSIQSKSKLFGSTYRLVIRLGDESENEEQAFWVERSTKRGVVLKGESPIQDLLENPDKIDSDDNASTKSASFTMASKIFKKPKIVPDGLRINSVEMAKLEKEIKSGYVYIYFLPQGLVDKVAVHFKTLGRDPERHWTITFHPLTGRAQVTTQYTSLKELYNQ